MEYVIYFLISFIIVYLFYFSTVIIQKKKYDKFKKSNQVMYFVNKYKLNVNKININKFIKIISLTNSFIISLSFTLIVKIENIILMLFIGLVVLIPTMLICYHFIGRYLQKEEK